MYEKEIGGLKKHFDDVIARLNEDFANVRTGRASASLIENIPVTYYGTTTPLKQMATLSVPDATQILVQPWDKESLGDIELAIKNSQVNLSSVNDGRTIRVQLPPMTQERREELIRLIHRKGEEGRIALRGSRQEIWDKIKRMEKDGSITEDDRYGAEKELNKLIEDYNKKIEDLVSNKERELRVV